jgi:hypothetical protein
MAIQQMRDVARADMNDAYGVTCYQEQELVDLTTDEARAYAQEIQHAADQADLVARQDEQDRARYVPSVALSGEVVI